MNNDQEVFQSPISQKAQAAQQPVASVIQPSAQPAASQPPQGPTSFYRSDKNQPSKAKRLLAIFLGLFVVVLIIALIFFVIIPGFMKNTGGEKVTLTYWGLWEDSKTMQGIISQFESKNPNIKIDYSQQTIKQYRERLTTRINNGTGPDIFRFHNTWYPMFLSVLLPLPSDTISKADFSKNFYPVAQKDLIRNGAIYGIPLEVDTLALFINTELFSSAGLTPPTTWNDFINDARAMTVKDENKKIKTAGAAMGTYDNITHAPDIISMLFLQNGVDMTNLKASSDKVSGALTFYTSFTKDENNVWDSTLDPSILSFSKGNLAMYFGYSWDFFTIKQYNKNLSFEIVPVPQLPNKNVTMASYWAEGVSVKSPHQKEALLFMKFLAQKETETRLYSDAAKERAFGEPYARVDLAGALRDNKNVYPFVYQAQNASSFLFVDGTSDNGLNQQLDTYLGNAVNSVLSFGSADSAFDPFYKGVSQVLQKYGQ